MYVFICEVRGQGHGLWRKHVLKSLFNHLLTACPQETDQSSLSLSFPHHKAKDYHSACHVSTVLERTVWHREETQ